MVDPLSIEKVGAGTVSTTDATQTGIFSLPVASGETYLIQALISGTRTGGSGGTAGDGATYVLFGTFKNVSGTLSQVGGSVAIPQSEDQIAWAADFSTTMSTNQVTVYVQGAANNNVDWAAVVKYYKVT